LKQCVSICCLILLLLTGCSTNEGKQSNLPSIEQYDWEMTTVQSVEAEGQAIAYGPGESSTLDTAVEILLSCTAKNGELTLNDETNGASYSGTYKLTDTSQESLIYEVTVGETAGMAVVAMTTYHDESQVPTLIISLGDYALNFFANAE